MVFGILGIIVVFKLIFGCLWLFIRYGDKVFVGVCVRLFVVVWILIGLVMVFIFVGVIVIFLIFSMLENDIILYGIEVYM